MSEEKVNEAASPADAPAPEKKAKSKAPKAEPQEAPKISEAELKKQAEEAAFDRVCRALGVNPNEVREAEKVRAQAEEVLEYDIGSTVVWINGVAYSGQGKAPRGVVEVLLHAAGTRRMRLLREKIGHDYLLQEIAGGGFGSKLIGKVNEEGEKLA